MTLACRYATTFLLDNDMFPRAPSVPSLCLTALLCATFAALTAAAQEGREHFVPLFMSDEDPDGRQGFMRIVNHSDRAGTVQIYGIDDAGERRGPIDLSIDALETVHVNSEDVEEGNTAKGLSGGLGAGEGDWRLLLYGGGLDIEPLAYIRTMDGFLTSMHDVVRETALRHRVPIFNPGSNDNQRSWLRLVNPGDAAANVPITGRDDTGATSVDPPRVTIPAGAAVTLSAQDLEAGTGGVNGQLGDGAGKWSLDVAADRPILVMSLMTLPTGHLSNLSGARPEYRGATGLWRIAFDDAAGGEGYLLLLPDSRMYAWLPESADTNRIARATYETATGTVSGSGELFESGNIQLVGADVSGGSEAFSFTAEYRFGDWIRGSYTPAGGSPRSFHGWAFTGFERGGSNVAVAGLWSPTLGEDADLPGELEPDAGGDFELDFTANGIRCEADGVLAPVNPAFAAYEAAPAVRCLVLQFPSGTVELILAVMDSDGAPGGGDRALGLVVIPDDRKIALGALFDLSRS